MVKYFKNIKQKGDVLTFELHTNKKVDKSLANAIRRIAISEVSIYAINKKDTLFQKNTTVLNNEFISRRLALIPINYTEAKKYDLEKLEIKLSVENQEDEIKNIFAKDLVFSESEKILDTSKFIKEGEILLTKLKPFQELEFTAKLHEGSQKTVDASMCPVSVAIFTYKEDPKALEKALKDVPKEFHQDFSIENQERFFIKSADDQPLVFDFMIESVGQLPPKDILLMSFDILDNRLDTLIKALKEKVVDTITIETPQIAMTAFDFKLFNEDDTLGNLLTSYLNINVKVAYAGYLITHPLEKTVIIRTVLKENNDLENNEKVFIENINYVKNLIMELKKDWKGHS